MLRILKPCPPIQSLSSYLVQCTVSFPLTCYHMLVTMTTYYAPLGIKELSLAFNNLHLLFPIISLMSYRPKIPRYIISRLCRYQGCLSVTSAFDSPSLPPHKFHNLYNSRYCERTSSIPSPRSPAGHSIRSGLSSLMKSFIRMVCAVATTSIALVQYVRKARGQNLATLVGNDNRNFLPRCCATARDVPCTVHYVQHTTTCKKYLDSGAVEYHCTVLYNSK